MYLPVVLQWFWLSVRYRSLTLPLIANPSIPLAGMVGGSKDLLMSQATGACREAILPWTFHQVTEDAIEAQALKVLETAQSQGIMLPFVCKPDMGCRGAGVKLIRSLQQLTETLRAYPRGAGLICQKLASYEPEVGIFFVRHPNQPIGKIESLTIKHTPHVVGDGNSTLRELVAQDPRAGQLLHLYATRNEADWERVLPSQTVHRLLFSASHCRGAVFEDARSLITQELSASINRIMADLPEFYYGRLDVKFKDRASLQAGETLEIVEINGASSESIHIWDKNARLLDAIGTLLWQYRTLFQIGAFHRQQGRRTPGIKALLSHWLMEHRLTRFYPETD
jgi:ferredoxin